MLQARQWWFRQESTEKFLDKQGSTHRLKIMRQLDSIEINPSLRMEHMMLRDFRFVVSSKLIIYGEDQGHLVLSNYCLMFLFGAVDGNKF